MKEAGVCFSEMELVQNRWMSREDRQVLESKDVPRDPKKQVSLGTQRGIGGGRYFAAQGDKPCFNGDKLAHTVHSGSPN